MLYDFSLEIKQIEYEFWTTSNTFISLSIRENSISFSRWYHEMQLHDFEVNAHIRFCVEHIAVGNATIDTHTIHSNLYLVLNVSIQSYPFCAYHTYFLTLQTKNRENWFHFFVWHLFSAGHFRFRLMKMNANRWRNDYSSHGTISPFCIAFFLHKFVKFSSKHESADDEKKQSMRHRNAKCINFHSKKFMLISVT